MPTKERAKSKGVHCTVHFNTNNCVTSMSLPLHICIYALLPLYLWHMKAHKCPSWRPSQSPISLASSSPHSLAAVTPALATSRLNAWQSQNWPSHHGVCAAWREFALAARINVHHKALTRRPKKEEGGRKKEWGRRRRNKEYEEGRRKEE